LTYSGGTDAEAFAAFTEQVLGPRLRSGDVVVLDNLSAPEGERVRQEVEARGGAAAPAAVLADRHKPTCSVVG